MNSGHACWCCASQRMVHVDGKIVGRHVAEVLKVSDCSVKDCSSRGFSRCLVGHEIEGRC